MFRERILVQVQIIHSKSERIDGSTAINKCRIQLPRSLKHAFCFRIKETKPIDAIYHLYVSIYMAAISSISLIYKYR